MTIPFNHVLAIRGAGSLMPASTQNKVEVSDCMINALRIDNGLKLINKTIDGVISESEIVPNVNNLPLNATNSDWSVNTEFYAMFNGDLEAGPLSFFGNEVDSIMVRRTSNRKGFKQWEDVNLIEDITSRIDDKFNYSFYDRCVESGIIYRYGLQPISQEKRGTLFQGGNTNVVYEDIFLVGENGKQLKIKF